MGQYRRIASGGCQEYTVLSPPTLAQFGKFIAAFVAAVGLSSPLAGTVFSKSIHPPIRQNQSECINVHNRLHIGVHPPMAMQTMKGRH